MDEATIKLLDKIIDEIADTDISAYDFKVVNEIIEKHKQDLSV